MSNLPPSMGFGSYLDCRHCCCAVERRRRGSAMAKLPSFLLGPADSSSLFLSLSEYSAMAQQYPKKKFDRPMASSSINKSLAGLSLADKARFRAVLFSSFNSPHQGHVIRETNKAFIFQMDLLRIGKDDVEVYVEGKNIIFKAKYPEDDVDMTGGSILYGTVLTENGEKTFDEKEFKLDEIDTHMNNGVLKVVVPM